MLKAFDMKLPPILEKIEKADAMIDVLTNAVAKTDERVLGFDDKLKALESKFDNKIKEELDQMRAQFNNANLPPTGLSALKPQFI